MILLVQQLTCECSGTDSTIEEMRSSLLHSLCSKEFIVTLQMYKEIQKQPLQRNIGHSRLTVSPDLIFLLQITCVFGVPVPSPSSWRAPSHSGSSCCSCCSTKATNILSAGHPMMASSSCSSQRKWPSCGACARTRPTWTMTSWAEHCATTMTRYTTYISKLHNTEVVCLLSCNELHISSWFSCRTSSRRWSVRSLSTSLCRSLRFWRWTLHWWSRVAAVRKAGAPHQNLRLKMRMGVRGTSTSTPACIPPSRSVPCTTP